MVALLREDWIKDPQLKKWNSVDCTERFKKCNCEDGDHLVELWDHDSCYRGRIDTVICTKCNTIKSYNIVR
jgi:hypothetical protein